MFIKVLIDNETNCITHCYYQCIVFGMFLGSVVVVCCGLVNANTEYQLMASEDTVVICLSVL